MNTAWTSEHRSYPVICLFGPTAVGKTDVLLGLFGGRSGVRPSETPGFPSPAWFAEARAKGQPTAEIVSADSMQVYRGLDIGTAKPGPEILGQLPHHLIDIRNPSEQYTAGDFFRDAERLVSEIVSRGRLPVISGGTAFYFKTFLFGLPETPKVDSRIRLSLGRELELKGLPVLYEELRRTDPEAAVRIGSNDGYRITRALEVFRSTGRPLSSFRVPDALRRDIAPLVLGLSREREELYRRIDERVDTMIARGLESEVIGLMERGVKADDPAMQAIGYREYAMPPIPGELPAPDMIKRNTRRYAKRQLTFFRSFLKAAWFHPEAISEIASAVEGYLSRFEGG